MPTRQNHKLSVAFAAMVLASALTSPLNVSGQSEFIALTKDELIAFVNSMPDGQKHSLAQNPQTRKALIDQFKKIFSYAQAALAERLDQEEDYAKSLPLETAKVLGQEFNKRNQDFQVTKTDIDAYVALHQQAFDTDVAYFTKNAKEKPVGDQLEALKASWGDLQIRAEKGRTLGLEADYTFQIQLKMMRANLLANLYSRFLEKRYSVTAEERGKYLSEHPEDDPEQIRQRVEQLLARIRNGESFATIADQINEDGTKGRGGDLDWFSRETMDPGFGTAAFALGTGEISGVVKSSFGFHLIKVEGKRRTFRGNKFVDEIRARHIYLSTKKVEEATSQRVQEKIKQEMNMAMTKYPVQAPEDFTVTVEANEKPSVTNTPGKKIQ